MGLVSRTGTFIYNRLFGLCTKKQIGQTVSKVGEKLAEAAKSGIKTDTSTVPSVFTACMPKGVRPPRITSSGKDMADFLSKNWEGIPQFPAVMYEGMSGAFCIAGSRDSSFIFIPNNSWFKNSKDFVNVVTHEFRHFLDTEKSSVLSPLKRFGNGILHKLSFGKYKPKVNQKLQEKYGDIQNFIAFIMGKSSLTGLVSNAQAIKTLMSDKSIVPYFRRFLRNCLSELPLNERTKLLRKLRPRIISEAAAYNAGGRAARLISGNSSDDLLEISEVMGLGQAKMLEAVDKELSMLKNPRYRRCAKKIISTEDKRLFIKEPAAIKKIQDAISAIMPA